MSSSNPSTPATGGGTATAAAPPSAEKILKEVMHKITQIVVRARIPAHAELEKSSPLNKWFNFHVPEFGGVRGELELLLRSPSDGSSSASNSITSSQFLSGGSASSVKDTSSPVTSSIIQIDILLRNSKNHNQYVLIERWNIQHERHSNGVGSGSTGDLFQSSTSTSSSAAVAASRKTDPGTMYKKLIILVRSLYTFAKLLPAHSAWKLAQISLEQRQPSAFQLTQQLSSSEKSIAQLIQLGLATPPTYGSHILTPVFDQSPTHFTFNSVATPMGRFTLSVFHRPELHSIDFLQSAGISIGSMSAKLSMTNNSSLSNHNQRTSTNSSGGGEATVSFSGSVGEHTTIISDYMQAPETNRPNPFHMMSGHMGTQQEQTVTPNPPFQQVTPPSQSQPPKSALTMGLEIEKQKRENSGNAGQLQGQGYQQQQQQQQPMQPQGFQMDQRRHTVPPNQLLPQPSNSYEQSMPPRTDRAQSVFQSPTGQPINSHQPPYSHSRSRGNSDSSDSMNMTSASTSKPMSIPYNSAGGLHLHGNTAPHSLPAHLHHSNGQSPSSDPPSFSSTPSSLTTGITSYSPFNTQSGFYLNQRAGSGSHLPYNHSGSKLDQLIEESEEDRFNYPLVEDQQPERQQLYDQTPSGSQHLPITGRLPHSHSQPIHMRPNSSGTLPINIQPSSSASASASPSAASSRRNSFTNSPTPDTQIGGSYKSSNRPPLPTSSRVTTSTSTFSPSLNSTNPTPSSTIVIREKDASQSPFAGVSSGSSLGAGRFSGTSATLAFPPPILGSSSPASSTHLGSGLSQALAAQSSHAHTASGSNPNSNVPSPTGGSPQSRVLAGSPSNSPSMIPAVSPFATSGSALSRAIPIPSRPPMGSSPGTAAGSLFGRTPPFAQPGIVGSLGGTPTGTGVGSFISTGSVTALGLMKQSTSNSPTPNDPVPRNNNSISVGSWHDLPPPIQLSVTPFKQPTSHTGRRSMSSSPALQPTNTRVNIAPQVPNLDLRFGTTPTSSDSASGIPTISLSSQPSSPIVPLTGPGSSGLAFHSSPLGVDGGFDSELSGIGGGQPLSVDDGEAALGKFLSYIHELQQSDQPQLQLFQNPTTDDPNSISPSPSTNMNTSHSSSVSSSQLGGGGFGTIRQTSVQSIFDQMDRLSQSTTFQTHHTHTTIPQPHPTQPLMTSPMTRIQPSTIDINQQPMNINNNLPTTISQPYHITANKIK